MTTPHRAQTGDGQPIEPGTGVVPILKEVGRGRLSVIGTGFYVTRYGLFLTAKHVLEDLVDWTTKTVGTAYLVHLAGDNEIHLRKVLRISMLQSADVGIGHADNYLTQYPDNPLANLRATLSTSIPGPGAELVTYAYPENEILDFTRPGEVPRIVANYFEGNFLRSVIESENPFLPYPHFETSIEIRSGASGGPVFDPEGRVVGVNCRGWDFRGSEQEGNNLSSILPITALLPLEVELLQVPPHSWEYAQLPAHRQTSRFTVAELIAYGHISCEPPL